MKAVSTDAIDVQSRLRQKAAERYAFGPFGAMSTARTARERHRDNAPAQDDYLPWRRGLHGRIMIVEGMFIDRTR